MALIWWAINTKYSPRIGERLARFGRICLGARKINLSVVFAGQVVGMREVADQVWQVSFMDYDLGFFDKEETG